MIKCTNCGDDTDNPKFCSLSCANSYSGRHRKRKEKKQRACLYCGKNTINPKFCNNSCSASYNNKIRHRNLKSLRANKQVCKVDSCDTITFGYNSYCDKCISRGEHLHNKARDFSGAKSDRTRKRILLEQRGHSCEMCGRKTWMDNPIPIELDHIDGNSENSSEDNLRLICPNCHAQTPTYKSRNVGKGRHWRKERYNQGKSY